MRRNARPPFTFPPRVRKLERGIKRQQQHLFHLKPYRQFASDTAADKNRYAKLSSTLLLVNFRLTFGARAPATMNPKPLFRITPDDVFDDFRITRGVRLHVPVSISSFNSFHGLPAV